MALLIPHSTIVLSEAEIRACDVAIRAIARRLSAQELTVALSISWEEYLRGIRKAPSEVTDMPDTEIEKYYRAWQRIFGEELTILSKGHWTVGSA